jgi:hypothetical protein
MGIQRDLLVNAWYTGGVDVIDFTNPTKLREIAYYDIAGPGPAGSDSWSAYPYQGPTFRRGLGVPIYASDRGPHPRLRQGSRGVSAPLRKAGADVRSPEPADDGLAASACDARRSLPLGGSALFHPRALSASPLASSVAAAAGLLSRLPPSGARSLTTQQRQV